MPSFPQFSKSSQWERLNGQLSQHVQKAEGSTTPNSSNEDGDPEELIKLDERLKDHFTKSTRFIVKTKSHPRVAVLLLSWELEHKDDMDFRGETQDLKSVFEDTYHFDVCVKFLNTASDSSARSQLNMHLAKFIHDYDRDGVLLIIYYGGHGIRNLKDGRLTLVQGNSSPQSSRLTQIVWDRTAQLLEETRSDRLLIFDCCYAGILERQPRNPDVAMYEFIGSTPFNRSAIGPSKHSFTQALIESLKKLSTRKDGFTTSELLHEIKVYPEFLESGQQPVSSELCSTASFRKLQIKPLPFRSSHQSSDTDIEIEDAEPSPFRYNLLLNYTWAQKPTEAHITAMAKILRRLVIDEGVPIRQVYWQKLEKKGFAHAVTQAIGLHRTSLSAATSIVSPRESNSTVSLTQINEDLLLSPISKDEIVGDELSCGPGAVRFRLVRRTNTNSDKEWTLFTGSTLHLVLLILSALMGLYMLPTVAEMSGSQK